MSFPTPGRRSTLVRLVAGRDEPVRDRLIAAADDDLTEHGSLTGRFEAVAHRAGVSRTIAYRQLGSVSELPTQVGCGACSNPLRWSPSSFGRRTTVSPRSKSPWSEQCYLGTQAADTGVD